MQQTTGFINELSIGYFLFIKDKFTVKCSFKRKKLDSNNFYRGARGSIVVKALCYKLEDRRFNTR
jgi:hypothetical protein